MRWFAVSVVFYRQLVAALQQGAIAVATVVSSRGSVPREVGAKLFVDQRGTCVGTIGGGAGEAKVIQQAQVVGATGAPQWVDINLSGSPHQPMDGICGGWMQVWIDRWQGNAAIALAQTILTQLEGGQAVTVVTPLAAGRSPYLEVEKDRGREGEEVEGSALAVFREVLQPPPTLLMVGAGHCGIQLAQVAAVAGFEVMVQDDRPEWANREHYPQVAEIFTGAIATALTALQSHAQLYVALVTRGYQYDLAALKLLFQRDVPCQYIGMIGSQKRVRQVLQTLAQAGIDAAQLNSIYAPIGLDIGALTPAEIAVSITAELIRVRRGGTGRSLSSPANLGGV